MAPGYVDDAAASLLPSADEVRAPQARIGALFDIHVAPRFDYGEVRPWIRRHGTQLHSATGGNAMH